MFDSNPGQDEINKYKKKQHPFTQGYHDSLGAPGSTSRDDSKNI